MQRNWFLVTDIFSAKLVRYLSVFLLLGIFSLSIMSFRSEDDNSKKIKSSSKDSISGAKQFQDLLDNNTASPSAIAVALNPHVVPFVKEYLSKQSYEYDKMKDWGKPYFDLYDKILTENGLPDQLKYLSVIESDLQGNLVSSADAVGPWQLMPDEAQRFHLKVGNGKDERKNFYKSTIVATKLLRELHDEFGDWLLTIAAYNCGAGGLKRAIEKAGTSNFWELQYYLPEETRNHVKKYIATDYYFEGSGGITTMTAAETKLYEQSLLAKNNLSSLTQEEIHNTSVTDVSGKYNSAVISQNLLLDITLFNHLNPDFDKTIAEGEVYHLRLPSDKLSLFQSKKEQILRESVQLLLTSPAHI